MLPRRQPKALMIHPASERLGQALRWAGLGLAMLSVAGIVAFIFVGRSDVSFGIKLSEAVLFSASISLYIAT